MQKRIKEESPSHLAQDLLSRSCFVAENKTLCVRGSCVTCLPQPPYRPLVRGGQQGRSRWKWHPSSYCSAHKYKYAYFIILLYLPSRLYFISRFCWYRFRFSLHVLYHSMSILCLFYIYTGFNLGKFIVWDRVLATFQHLITTSAKNRFARSRVFVFRVLVPPLPNLFAKGAA